MSIPIRSFLTPLQKFKETQPWIYVPTTTSSFKILDAVDKFAEALYEQLVATPETLEIPVLESEGGEDWNVKAVELSIQPDTQELILDEEETIAFTELRHVCERSCPFRNRDLHFVDVLYIHQGKPKHLYIDIADGLLCLRLINIIRKIIFTTATSFEPVLNYMSPRFLEVSVDVDNKNQGPVNGLTNTLTMEQFVAALSGNVPPVTARLDEENGDVSRTEDRQTVPEQMGKNLMARTNESIIDVLPVENPNEEDEKIKNLVQKAVPPAANVEDKKEEKSETAEGAVGMNTEESTKGEDGEKVEEATVDRVDGATEERIGGSVAEEEHLKTEVKQDEKSDVSGEKTQQEACAGDTEETQERTEVAADGQAQETKVEKTEKSDEEKKEGENKDTAGEKGETNSEEKEGAASEEGKAVQPGTAGDKAPATVQDVETDTPTQMKPPTLKDPEMASSTPEKHPEAEKAPNTDNIDHGEEIIDVYTGDEDGNFPEDKEQQQIPPAQTQKMEIEDTKTDESETMETTTGDEKPEQAKAEDEKDEETAAGKEGVLEQKLHLMEMAPGYIGFYRGILQRSPVQVAMLLEDPGNDVVEFVRYNSRRSMVYIETPSHGFNITGEESKVQEIADFMRGNKPMPNKEFNDLQALASHLYSMGFQGDSRQEASSRDVVRSTAAVSAAPSGRLSQDNDEAVADEEQRKQNMIDESLAIARSKMDFLEAYHNNIRDAANPQEAGLIDFLNSNWMPMELDIQEKAKANLIPECDSKSLALDPNDLDHFSKAMNDVQEYLMNMEPIMAASRLRSYREVFMESSMREMKAIFEAFDEATLLKALYVMALMQNMN